MNESNSNHEYGVRAVGVHGMGGMGKSTITRAICNEMYGDFIGKVCHVELGKNNIEEVQRKVLQDLTEAAALFD
jgi:GTPase SAR1 family protein